MRLEIMNAKRLAALVGFCVCAMSAIAAPADTTELTAKDASLLAGAAVALLTWIGGQIVIPLYKYNREQRRGKILIVTIMKVAADKTLDFFGENLSTSVFDKVLYQIDEQIDSVGRNPNYFAHISVSEEDSIKTKVMDEEYFWLVDSSIIQAFIKFEENGSRARFMCKSVMDKGYLKLVKEDRARYIAALKQIRQQFVAWLESTKELQSRIKDYQRSLR